MSDCRVPMPVYSQAMNTALIAYEHNMDCAETNPGELSIESDVHVVNVFLFASRYEAERAQRKYLAGVPEYANIETAVVPVDDWCGPCRNGDEDAGVSLSELYGVWADDGR